MVVLPKSVIDAWQDRDGPAVLVTVSEEGTPNAVYIASVSIFEDNRFVIADNYFDKTRKNILNGSPGSLLFLDKTGKSYQVKGTYEYHKEGELFALMKAGNPPEHPGHAAVVLCAERVYSGAKRLC